MSAQARWAIFKDASVLVDLADAIAKLPESR
jgi:hypothetical protein